MFVLRLDRGAILPGTKVLVSRRGTGRRTFTNGQGGFPRACCLCLRIQKRRAGKSSSDLTRTRPDQQASESAGENNNAKTIMQHNAYRKGPLLKLEALKPRL